jgi:hypothetical protein
MGEVQAQVLVADLNDDGMPEILAADVRGSVAMFNTRGEEIWERHLKSMISQVGAAGWAAEAGGCVRTCHHSPCPISLLGSMVSQVKGYRRWYQQPSPVI